MLSPLLQRLQDTLENPGLYRPLTAEEQAELFLTLFAPKAKRKVKVIQGIDGKTPEKDKDYLSKETSEQLIAELASKTKAELEALIATKLASVTNGKDGSDAVITPELVASIAELAQSMIVLPDFHALLTMEPEAIRNALELLSDGEKLVQEAIEGLPEDLEDIRRRLDKSQNIIAAGVTQAGVLRLIEENATALPVGGTTGQVLAKASNTDGDAEWVNPGAGAAAWGDITGTLSNQTDLQTALNGKANSLGVDDNYVTDAEKTKLSNLSGVNTGDQDLSSYLTSATAATTYEPIKGADDNFVTDAEKVKLANLSGTNSGDQTSIVGITGTKAQFNTAVTDGDILYTDAIGVTVQGYSAVLAATTASFTTADETKLDGIAAGAEVNVNADWNAISGDAQILNKPTISGSNTGDQTTIVGITGTKAQFDTAVTDGNFLYVGDVTTNATHTGDVTGATALTIDKTAITGKTVVTALGTDYVLISDTSDTGNLKKALLSDVITPGTNLTYTAATRVIASDTGTDATLPLMSSADAGLVPASGGGTTNFLRADGTFAAPTASATITTQEEGVSLSTTVTTLNFTGAGVTASGAGATTTIDIPGGAGGGVSLGLSLVVARNYLRM